MNPESLRVRTPSSVVFLCGGAIGDPAEKPIVLRDAFHRVAKVSAPDYRIILAELAQPLTEDAGYGDLLSFESDIAQVVGLILLFAESPGSLAELGAFAALKTVAPSLLAVLDDHYYNESSFIRNGPVKFLENTYGEEWIHVLEREEIGIAKDDLSNLNIEKFSSGIVPAVKKRLDARSGWSKFDIENSGHEILLMSGLCQEYGALTITEIRDYFKLFGIESPRLKNFIYCATLLKWIHKVRKGNNIFYVARSGRPALDFNLKTDASHHDKLRWRSDIRSYWRIKDQARMRAILETAGLGGEI